MPAPGQTTPVLPRLLAKVKREDSGCWVFIGGRARGYGMIWEDGRQRKAHRVAYERLVGPIPEGLQLDHLCRNPACVNPDHLEPVTAQVNVLRSTGPCAQNAKKTHCPQNHPYSGANLHVKPNGNRVCRICRTEGKRRLRLSAAPQ